jgi:hypothetical protein
MFTNSKCSYLSKWNPFLVQSLEELHAVLHVVPHLLPKFAHSLRDLPLVGSLTAQL